MKIDNNIKGLYLTEAGSKVGLGHLKRAHALIELLDEFAIEVKLEDSSSDPGFGELARWSSKEPIISISTDYDVVFFDSFFGTEKIYRELQSLPCVVYIDDFIRYPAKRGMIVDWTVGAERREKTAEKHCFGLNYLVTRPEFRKRENNRPGQFSLNNIVVVFGGADPYDLTTRTNEILKNLSAYTISYLGTKLYPSYRTKQKNNDYCWDLPTMEYANKLASADLVITAGGQILYELASLGVPSISISVEENQDEDVDGFSLLGTTQKLKLDRLGSLPAMIEAITPSKLEEMTRATFPVSGHGKKLKEKIYCYVNECIV